MIRKCHNHKPKTNPWYREEEPHNHHETPGRQTKQSNQLSLPHQDDCKTRTDIKLVSKPPLPEQSGTKIDSSPLVSNSLIQMGLTFQAFVRPSVYSQIGHLLASFLFYVVSIWLNMTYIMESLPGVLGNRKNDVYSRGTGNEGQILS